MSETDIDTIARKLHQAEQAERIRQGDFADHYFEPGHSDSQRCQFPMCRLEYAPQRHRGRTGRLDPWEEQTLKEQARYRALAAVVEPVVTAAGVLLKRLPDSGDLNREVRWWLRPSELPKKRDLVERKIVDRQSRVTAALDALTAALADLEHRHE